MQGPWARPAAPLLCAQGRGRVEGRPTTQSPSRPRSLYLPRISPVIPVLLGFHHSPVSQVRSSHAEQKLRCPSCGQLHPRPSGRSLMAPPGPLPPACSPWSTCSLEEGLSLCLSVCLSGGLTPPFRVPVWARCAEPFLARSLDWTGLASGPESGCLFTPALSPLPVQLSAPGGRFVPLCRF